MDHFNIQKYNQLLSIEDADARLKTQLTAAGITLDELFSKLRPLFTQKGVEGSYAIRLLHHHYTLKDGERMVTKGKSTMPSTDTSSDIIVAESWFSTGEEFEHRVVEDPATLPPPPSSELLSEFRAITEAHGIDILGVAYAPTAEEVGHDFTILEDVGPRDREQITRIVRKSAMVEGVTYQAGWILHTHSDRAACNHCVILCHGCPP